MAWPRAPAAAAARMALPQSAPLFNYSMPMLSHALRQTRLRRYGTDVAVSPLFDGLIRHDRVALAKAITLVESTAPRHKQAAHELLALALQHQLHGGASRASAARIPSNTIAPRYTPKSDQSAALAAFLAD
ncbi:hypothetical protein GGF31_003887, partial [Allomyces arbusculus]